MALWPFRKKSSRTRRARTVPLDSSDPDASARGRQDYGPPRRHTDANVATARAKRDGPNKLHRRPRDYSYSPGRRDTLKIARTRKEKKESVPPVPAEPAAVPSTSNAAHGPQAAPAAPTEPKTSSDDLATRVPTLHHDTSRNKRKGKELPRKKSSKRRKEDHDREAEIKAMSQFVPTRPATDSFTAGRPVKKDSKRFKTGLHTSWDEPSSEVSLPMPESLHSAMSTDSECVSWKVSALSSLAPRPTIRCTSNPVYGPTSSSGPQRSQSTRRRISERGTIPESTLKAHKRVHDLAEDLDASDLRELMERDARRRERKKEREREKVERRLARRAEKQRAEEAEAARNGRSPPPNLERGVLGREMTESPGSRTSAVVTSSRRRSSSESPPRKGKEPAQPGETESHRQTPSPLDEFHRTDSIPLEPPTPVTATEPEAHPEPERPRSARSTSPRLIDYLRSRRSRSIRSLRSIRSKASRSNSPKPPAQEQSDVASPSPADGESVSRTSESKRSRAWKSLFKWGKNRRASDGPSSFENTSRDSMQAIQPPPPVNYMPPRVPSSRVPKRTMSRFREDLPELPASPPDSRVHSPEDEGVYPEPLPIIPDDVPTRYDTPTSAHRATPSLHQRDEVQASPAPQSMSLASIDSEASWLSGRISRKRTSSAFRNSLQHPPRRISGLSEGSEIQGSDRSDDDHIADDEYLNSVVPPHMHRKSTGEARPSSDEEETEAEPKWGDVGHTPTVMHHRETMRSQVGLLDSLDDEKEFAKEAEDDDEGQSPVRPQRASSINLGKGHGRQFSAGSAKLLEISPRPSTERRRSGLRETGTQ
ncbi:hypothetical protein F4780DRAFT_579155 [Xylariomycetidae sp. FL0641]|nr:hypothetical protein F4780DRAFT_579155 [Xylariomycetidae sp. FL0641]